MKTQLQNKLIKKYSSFFTINKDIEKGQPFYPIAFGMECGDGWYTILENLFKKLDKLQKDFNKNHDEKIDVKFTQVKEKFGSLQVYVDSALEEMHNAIHDAELESWETCEFCGSKEDIGHTEGWIFTICKKCYDKDENMNHKWKPYKKKIKK